MKINVKIIDSGTLYGGRVLEIKTRKGIFKTPFRVATNSDYTAKNYLPSEVEIGNPLNEIINDFNKKDYESFLTGNGSFKHRTSQINKFADVMSYGEIISTIQLPKETQLNNKELFLTYHLQQNQDILFTTIPNTESTIGSKYEDIVEKLANQIKNDGKEPMVQLDMDLPLLEFKSKLKFIVELNKTELINSISLIFRSPKTHIQQFYEINELKDIPIMIHCFYIPKTPSKSDSKYPFAQIHYLQKFGIDTYSPLYRKPDKKFVGYMLSQKTEEDLQKINLFDKETLGILSVDDLGKRYGENLNCNCKICRNSNIKDFIDKYGFDKDSNPDLYKLKSAVRLHELFGSLDEFKNSQKAIIEDSLNEYFKGKEFARKYINDVEGDKLNGY